MSIKVIYLGVIIPLVNVESCKAIGGVKGILEKQKDHLGIKDQLNKRVLVDDYLYKDGAMGSYGIELIGNFWKDQGLILTEVKDGKEVWKDICVVDMVSGPTLPCDWLEFDNSKYPDPPVVWMKGTSKDEDKVIKVMDIVLSSTRPMPAHFTTNGDRKQSFCVDFDISPDDEYNMASFAWTKGTDNNKVIKMGEDVVVGSYILKKLNGEHRISELTSKLIEADSKSLTINPEVISSPEVRNYIQACQEYGLNLTQ